MAITGVAHSLIPLGAIRRHFHIVGLLSPKLIAIKLIHLGILAGKIACPLHIGMDGISGKQAFLILHAGQLHIPEPHISKPGAVDTASLAIDDFRLGFAKVCGVQTAIGIQYLTVAQFQPVTFHLCRVNTNYARKILPKIQNGHITPLGNGLHRHFFPNADIHGAFFQIFGNSSFECNRLDDLLLPGLVVDFAVIESGIFIRGSNCFNRCVTGTEIVRTTIVSHHQNPGNCRCFSVNLHLVVEGEPTAVPSLSQIYRQHIVTGKHLRQIVGLEIQMAGIVGKSRSKEGIPQLFPVQLYLIQAQRRNGKGRFFYILRRNSLPEDFYRTLPVRTVGGNKMFVQVHKICPFRRYCQKENRTGFPVRFWKTYSATCSAILASISGIRLLSLLIINAATASRTISAKGTRLYISRIVVIALSG